MKPILQFCVTCLLIATANLCAATEEPSSPFQQRGYYFTFCRMPEYGLEEWQEIVDCVQEDGGNTMILWVGGAFRSRAYPITWQYNRDHQNVRNDFLRDLIDYAHTQHIQILLGFTPYGYDGVNQYSQEHPELIARGPDGGPATRFGIHSWGYNLCPAQPESRKMMLEYVREMLFDFYPNSDGLLIESSDYSICYCEDCREKFFDHEFEFVRTISDELWAARPSATIMVYPRYFDGADVPGFRVKGTEHAFDPRWTVFFTPHSAHIQPDLVQQARGSIWSDDAPALRTPAEIQRNAKIARDAGLTGYLPSLETFSYLSTEAEEGQNWLRGYRQIPLGMGWLESNEQPYGELPIRVQRIAYEAFASDPDLSDAEFHRRVGEELFIDSSDQQAIDDALRIQQLFASERTWYQPSPVVSLARCRALVESGQLTNERKAKYRQQLDEFQAIANRYQDSKSPGKQALYQTAEWVVEQWNGESLKMLADVSEEGP